MKEQVYVKKFINFIKERYKGLDVSYLYDSDEDMFYIYHNDVSLESDSGFTAYVGELMKTILLNNNVQNYAFDYDFDSVLLKPRDCYGFSANFAVEVVSKIVLSQPPSVTYSINYSNDSMFPKSITLKGYKYDNSKGNNYYSTEVAA